MPVEAATYMALSKVQRGVNISGARLRRMRVLGQTPGQAADISHPAALQNCQLPLEAWPQAGGGVCRYLGQLLPSQALLTVVFFTAQSFTDNRQSQRIYNGAWHTVGAQ